MAKPDRQFFLGRYSKHTRHRSQTTHSSSLLRVTPSARRGRLAQSHSSTRRLHNEQSVAVEPQAPLPQLGGRTRTTPKRSVPPGNLPTTRYDYRDGQHQLASWVQYLTIPPTTGDTTHDSLRRQICQANPRPYLVLVLGFPMSLGNTAPKEMDKAMQQRQSLLSGPTSFPPTHVVSITSITISCITIIHLHHSGSRIYLANFRVV